jgi:hypothetical protein
MDFLDKMAKASGNTARNAPELQSEVHTEVHNPNAETEDGQTPQPCGQPPPKAKTYPADATSWDDCIEPTKQHTCTTCNTPRPWWDASNAIHCWYCDPPRTSARLYRLAPRLRQKGGAAMTNAVMDMTEDAAKAWEKEPWG